MPRPKGYKCSPETIEKQKATRAANAFKAKLLERVKAEEALQEKERASYMEVTQ